MAGRRSRVEYRPVGELALKGLSDPVATVELLWEPLAGSAVGTVPLPGRVTVRPSAGVVGRDTELALIADAAKRIYGSDGREVLLVSGEAGLGKTTLVAEAARSAYDAGACVLFGHCEEDLATPYQLFAEALGHYVAHTEEEQLRELVEAHGSEWMRLVPALASRIPDLPPSKATDSDSEALPPLRSSCRPLGLDLPAAAGRARARRPAVGGQRQPLVATAPGGGRAPGSPPRARHVP